MEKKILKVLFYIGILIIVFGIAVGISFAIYYATKSDNDLQIILTTMLAAVYGGLLTLVGVAWTFKKSDKDRAADYIAKEKERLEDLAKRDEERKQDWDRRDAERREDERKKYKPVFHVFNSVYTGKVRLVSSLDFIKNEGFSYKANDELKFPCAIEQFMIKNIDFSVFYVYGFKINGNIVKLNSFCFVNKDEYLGINFPDHFFTKQKIESFSILTIDLLENIYETDFSFNSETACYPYLTEKCDGVEGQRLKIKGNKQATLTDIKVEL